MKKPKPKCKKCGLPLLEKKSGRQKYHVSCGYEVAKERKTNKVDHQKYYRKNRKKILAKQKQRKEKFQAKYSDRVYSLPGQS